MPITVDANFGERQAARMEQVDQKVRELLTAPEVTARLRSSPAGDEWSAVQVLGHMVEMIPYWFNHCRAIIAAQEPPQFGRMLDAPERLEGVERGLSTRTAELLDELGASVRDVTKGIRGFAPADWQKTGIHVRRGEMTVADIVDQLIVSHAEEHRDQIQTLLKG